MIRIMLFLCMLILAVSSGTVSAQTSGTVLEWQNTSTDLSIAIERAIAPTGPYTDLATASPASVTYTDAGPFAQGEQVCYRLAYSNTAGKGPYSNVACKTFPILAPVNAPGVLTVR